MSRFLLLILGAIVAISAPVRSEEARSLLPDAMSKVVKIFGAGGVGRIEAYGTGVLVSDDGCILTMFGPMLETENLRVVLADGRRRIGRVVGVDQSGQLALVRIDAEGLAHFSLDPLREDPMPGDAIWALSNLFGIAAGEEAISVQAGIIAARGPLTLSEGAGGEADLGDVYFLDAITNNPGASGGAVIDMRGRLIGIIGKERRSAATGTWVNFAIPTQNVASFVALAREGRAPIPERSRDRSQVDRQAIAKADLRGIVLLPEPIEAMPPFIDAVEPNSPAALAGLRPDDLILFVSEAAVRTTIDVRAHFSDSEQRAPVHVVVLRGEELVAVDLESRDAAGVEDSP